MILASRLSPALAAAAVLLALTVATWPPALAPPTAQAYRLGGEKWPKRTVTYAVSAHQYRTPARDAARAWNRSGARIRFRRVRAVRRADVVVRYFRRGEVGSHEHGIATLGFPGPGEQASIALRRLPRRMLEGPSNGRALTMAHEFGHVLGLAHDNRRCALMNGAPLWIKARCRREISVGAVEPCSLLELDDIRGVVARYGGRIRRPKGRLSCARVEPPGRRTRSTAAGR